MANNNKNPNIQAPETKNMILKYLYSKVNLDMKQDNILNMSDLDTIKSNDYIICPRFSGTRCWILFFEHNDSYYAVSFPKHSQRKKEQINIYPIDCRASKELYRGTIMEGIYFKFDEVRYLVIDEVHVISGENQLLKSKDDRLDHLANYLKSNIQISSTFHIYVSQFYQINKNSLKKLFEKLKSDTNIQEIIFYPKIYGGKIYRYTIIDEDLTDHVIKLAYFNLQKTPNPDVYNLMCGNTNTKVDIAYIPDIECSKKCKRWFKDHKKNILPVKCQMDMDKNKWIPIELVESEISDIDE